MAKIAKVVETHALISRSRVVMACVNLCAPSRFQESLRYAFESMKLDFKELCCHEPGQQINLWYAMVLNSCTMACHKRVFVGATYPASSRTSDFSVSSCVSLSPKTALVFFYIVACFWLDW